MKECEESWLSQLYDLSDSNHSLASLGEYVTVDYDLIAGADGASSLVRKVVMNAEFREQVSQIVLGATTIVTELYATGIVQDWRAQNDNCTRTQASHND